MSDKKKLYVGCSIRHAPEGFVESIEAMKHKLEDSFELLHFVPLTQGSERDVYLNDIGCVRSCDALLAVCDLPSLGLGFEMASALSMGKRVLAGAHRDAVVSRMIIGIDDPNFSFVRYDSLDEFADIARKHLGA